MWTAKKEARQQAREYGLDPDLARHAGRRARYWRRLGLGFEHAVRFGVSDARVAQRRRELAMVEAL